MNQVKMQIACLCFLGYLMVYYRSIKKLKTRSSKLYEAIVWTCMFSLIFDLCSVYTVNHLEFISASLNNICTKIFILSCSLLDGLICTYIINLTGQSKKSSKLQKTFFLMPTIILMGIALFGKMHYQMGGSVKYAYGVVVDACYISIIIYIVVTLYYTCRYWKKINRNCRKVAVASILIIIVFSLIQRKFPMTLILSLGGSLCTFGIFISLENPNSFIEKQFNYFNDFALLTILKERLDENKGFSLVVVMLENMEDIREEYGQKVEAKLYEVIEHNMLQTDVSDIYLYTPNILISILDRESNGAEKVEILQREFSKCWQVAGKDLTIKAQLRLIDIAPEVADVEDVMNKIVEIQTEIKNQKVYMDNLLEIQNRNAFEREMEVINPNRYEYESLCYITIDLNGLKKTNDQFGHLAGDHLLKRCVSILVEAIGDKSTIYRLGGDEFGMILTNTKNGEIGELLRRIEEVRQEANQSQIHPVSFAIGYAFFNGSRDSSLSDMVKRADKMMYHNKFEMKKTMKG